MTTYALNQIQSYALPKQSHAKKIVSFGLCALALLVSMYVYFVGKIVFDVVARRGAESSIRMSESVVSGLEVAYFKQLQALDTSSGIASVGLLESHDTLYTSRLAEIPATVGMANE
jgi:hypothetical protein